MPQKRNDSEGTLSSFGELLEKLSEVDGLHGPRKGFADPEVDAWGSSESPSACDIWQRMCGARVQYSIHHENLSPDKGQ